MYDELKIREIIKEDSRYKLEAYYFVWDAMKFAYDNLILGSCPKNESCNSDYENEELDEPENVPKHLTGEELCNALRIYSLHMFGFMAKTVLAQWGVKKTDDFGSIVYNMVRHGNMRVTEKDKPDDFNNLYDFQTAFCDEFVFTEDDMLFMA